MRAKDFTGGVKTEAWSERYKKSINCSNPKGFSQRAHCQGKKKRGVSEAVQPDGWVYHAHYYENPDQGLVKIANSGLKPSREGYLGPGSYFAFRPEDTYYHVSPEDATMLRIKWDTLVDLYGKYPENIDGIQSDGEQIIVPTGAMARTGGVIPAKYLEVEYFPGEWWSPEEVKNMAMSMRQTNEDTGGSGSKIYLDMDGVLADFISGYNSIAGTDYQNQWEIPKAKNDPIFNKMVGTNFFSTLPAFATTGDIVDLALKFGGGVYSICSSPLRNDHENSAKHKTQWLQANLQQQPERIIITPKKEKYAVENGIANVLIDDKPQNIEKWRAAGGHGILYDARVHSTKHVEKELEKIFKKAANGVNGGNP